jgi:hypothetical protein
LQILFVGQTIRFSVQQFEQVLPAGRLFDAEIVFREFCWKSLTSLTITGSISSLVYRTAIAALIQLKNFELENCVFTVGNAVAII